MDRKKRKFSELAQYDKDSDKETNNIKQEADKMTIAQLMFFIIAILVKTVALFFISSLLLFGVWNVVIAKVLTFAKPMTSFWQAAFLMFWIELSFFVVLYRIGIITPDKYKELK